ncbi:DinB family protein [Deinococcus hopiensis]|nr:DinB family protein [Deinococcus hopiensis]
MTTEGFLQHWLGHRALTRRVIAAFPEDQLFTFTAAPPMRTFGELGGELHFVSEMTLVGLLTGEWPEPDWSAAPKDKASLLEAWDALSARIEQDFAKVDPAVFGTVSSLPWGQMPAWVAAIYAVDNEIHHRGQGYVYLRSLGIEPPAFYER